VPYQAVTFEKEESVALITLNRPDGLNAFNLQMALELEQIVDKIDADDSIRAVIITGAGRAFSAGADVKEVLSGDGIAQHLGKGKPPILFDKFENMDKPVIGAINGLAIGGGFELAMVCDLIIASSEAAFGFAEIRIGLIPSSGGTVRAPRIMSKMKAKELLLFGDTITAEEALRLGVINKVVTPESLLSEAKKWAKRLSQRPPLAVKAIKSCVNLGVQMPIEAAVHFEAKQAAILFNSEDKIEGINAFLEKRHPVFKGK